MKEKVRLYMERHQMAEWREPLWVAVSGGIDSMVLLHVLHALRHPCSVVHIDHGLRGTESDADHAFVKEHCEKLGLPFLGRKVDVQGHADARKVSIQMAARELRYAVFREITGKGSGKLALAHHQDDAIETLFIHLMHGMGLHGWQSIPPCTGPFIRPLMALGRQEIEDYAKTNGIAHREDASNAEHKYLRNRIRHELLPMLENWRPGVRRSLARSVDLFREMDQVVQGHLAGVFGERDHHEGSLRIAIQEILGHGTPRLMLYHLLRDKGFHPDRMDQLLRALEERRTGATFTDGGYCATVDREVLIIEKVQEEAPRSWVIGDLANKPDDVPLEIESVGAEDIDLSAGPTTAWLNADRLELPLEFRPWRAGDRMCPIGLKGTKLVSDILIDAKVARNEKGRTYVLISGGEIAWLVGHRIGAGFEARPGSRVVRFAAL